MVNLGLSGYLIQSCDSHARRLGPTGKATPVAAKEPIQHKHPSLC